MAEIEDGCFLAVQVDDIEPAGSDWLVHLTWEGKEIGSIVRTDAELEKLREE